MNLEEISKCTFSLVLSFFLFYVLISGVVKLCNQLMENRSRQFLKIFQGIFGSALFFPKFCNHDRLKALYSKRSGPTYVSDVYSDFLDNPKIVVSRLLMVFACYRGLFFGLRTLLEICHYKRCPDETRIHPS